MIYIDNVAKDYPEFAVLNGISFSVPTSRAFALVGPSGCGKSTLLSLIAGLNRPDAGRIDLAPGLQAVSYMFQDHLLLPWRTLLGNALLGREVIEGVGPDDVEVAERYFREFDLIEFKDVYPEAASGGMKQRVALIRTLLCGGSVLLLDEPFTSLDFEMKIKVQRAILRDQQRIGATMLIVTHDLEDAIVMADEVVVLTSRPARVRERIQIDLGLGRKDPIEARKAPAFGSYFTQIWDLIKS